MTRDLLSLVREELAVPVAPAITAFAAALAQRFEQALCVLFYGSVLRTGDQDGVLDFYVLTRGSPAGLRGLASRLIWPDVSYHQHAEGDQALRAKVASMTLAQFQEAVLGRRVDTTVWTRFVQPAALVWTADTKIARAVETAVAQASVTAARFAAALGPEHGPPDAFWGALFRQTYAAEFRVEAAGRERSILSFDPERYEQRLSAAWEAGDVAFTVGEEGLTPRLSPAERRRRLAAWRLRRRLGKPLNLLRLTKAAFTFEGAGRYAVWKIERHTGLKVELTPWRERHPILASPGVLWRLWRASRRRAQAEAR